MKVINIQLTSVPNVDQNLTAIESYLVSCGTDINGSVVVLPECCVYFGGRDNHNLKLAEQLGEGPIQSALKGLAKRFSCYLVAGSVPTKTTAQNKYANTCFVYSPSGELLCHYQKIHLFDVDVSDNTKSYRESDTTEAGDEIITFDTPWGRVGVAICYDLRFPALFQALRDKGAELIVLPSAFTQKTGEAHWKILLQARAIENQVYIAGCNQTGRHENGRETYGHSMVIDPWGEVLVDAEQDLGVSMAELDRNRLSSIRSQMPVKAHNRFASKLEKDFK